MAAHQKHPLRPLTAAEQTALERICRADSERRDVARRAAALLAVHAGHSFRAAARIAGFTTGASVAHIVQRFNQHGLAALGIAAGRGPKPRYDAAARSAIVALVRQPPDRQTDGTALWSLTTLQRRFRQHDPQFATLGRTTIHRVLRAAGYRSQRTRSWCPTGMAKRVRKEGVVLVSDPETEEKKA